jgi:indolepyruvate ferredoxin oxidoreductase beta subunit
MKTDIVLSGVGGQGVLTVGAIIAEAARREGLYVKQGEVHGMSQRGGAVQAFLRLSDRPIHSDLIPVGTADLIISLEPIEALRYVHYLKPEGKLVTAIEPFANIPDYPPREKVLGMLQKLPHVFAIEALAIAQQAGSPLIVNFVMVGAASEFLPIRPATLETCVSEGFARKGQHVVEANLKAFRSGREAVLCEKN